MDWLNNYKKKLTTADNAVSFIKPGDHVVLTHAASEPTVLVDAMVANARRYGYKDVKVSTMVTLGKGEYTKKELKDCFKFNGWFASDSTRQCLAEGHGDFIPVFFYEVPKLLRNGTFPVDVCMAMVSPPDEHGYCSLGVSSDYSMQAIHSAKFVIAQVNDQVPVVYGDTFIHVDEMNVIVEANQPIPEKAPAALTEEEKAIGKYCASLIPDGATLQLGIGAVPDAVLYSLKDKRDLGIHSEMISDGVIDLYEAGVINNSKKSIDQGKMVVSFLMGTKRLYDFAEKNPALEMRTVDYVNNPLIVAANSNMICINSALSVDFMGQIAADTIGFRQFSGAGGQVDFVRGAAMAEDGKGISIIAMPSITIKKDGTKISKIVPELTRGTAVTTSRQDADYIVTEYGIAPLKGRTLKERSRNLIAIAHPDFREQLIAAFEERYGVPF